MNDNKTDMDYERRGSRIAIIGSGLVGATIAYTLYMNGIAEGITLIDTNIEKAEGEALDFKHGAMFSGRTRVFHGDDYSLCKYAKIVIITAGISQKPGMTRLDLAEKNSEIVEDIVKKVVEHNTGCLILVVSNPVDVLTKVALKTSGFAPDKVFGSGTLLDTSRFRHNLSLHFNVNPANIHAYILGEHGDSEFPVWSKVSMAGQHLSKFDEYDEDKLESIFQATKNAAYDIISKKGATYYAIALAVNEIVVDIISNQRKIVPLSTLINDYYGVDNVCLSIPVVLDKNGIIKQVHLELNELEQQQFIESAKQVKSHVNSRFL